MTRKAFLSLPFAGSLDCDLFASRESPEEKAFRQALGSTSLTVFPTIVRFGSRATLHDTESTIRIAAFFSHRRLADVKTSHNHVEFPIKPGRNQARMWRESLAHFQEYLKAQPVPTKYAAVAEYLIFGEDTVGGVHMYLVQADGPLAWGTLLNSHWKEYRQVKPRGVDGATEVLLRRLQNELGRKPTS